MPLRQLGLTAAALLFSHAALAQDIAGVNRGVNSDGGAMTGPSINRVSGINANGTPRQLNSGASMTNGAGNSYMTPGVTGPIPGNSGMAHPNTVPPTVILHQNSSGQ